MTKCNKKIPIIGSDVKLSGSIDEKRTKSFKVREVPIIQTLN